MYLTVNNKYGEAEIYAKPIVSQPVPKDVFMGYVRESVEEMYARSNVTRNNYRIRANILSIILLNTASMRLIPMNNLLR
jgi:hypothetical protein